MEVKLHNVHEYTVIKMMLDVFIIFNCVVLILAYDLSVTGL